MVRRNNTIKLWRTSSACVGTDGSVEYAYDRHCCCRSKTPPTACTIKRAVSTSKFTSIPGSVVVALVQDPTPGGRTRPLCKRSSKAADRARSASMDTEGETNMGRSDANKSRMDSSGGTIVFGCVGWWFGRGALALGLVKEAASGMGTALSLAFSRVDLHRIKMFKVDDCNRKIVSSS